MLEYVKNLAYQLLAVNNGQCGIIVVKFTVAYWCYIIIGKGLNILSCLELIWD